MMMGFKVLRELSHYIDSKMDYISKKSFSEQCKTSTVFIFTPFMFHRRLNVGLGA